MVSDVCLAKMLGIPVNFFFDCERDRCVAQCKTSLTAFITPRREITLATEGRSNHILAIFGVSLS